MKRGVFLQVRLNSSRLPRKALLPLAGQSVVEHAMDSLALVDAQVHAILTDAASADTLRPYADRSGFDVFVGSPDDVLSRYADAARRYAVNCYVRATGDNPLVSAKLANCLLDVHEEARADFSGFLGPPLGTGVEIVQAAALFEAEREAEDPYEREHVSPFIYRRPERYSVQRPWAPEEANLPEARVTLDTESDLALLRRIYDSLYDGVPVETDRLVSWLRENEESWRSNGNGQKSSVPVCSLGGAG